MKINNLLFMDDLKLHSCNEKEFDSLVQTSIFSKDKRMKVCMDKCAMIVTEKEKIVKSVGMELPNGQVIKSLHEAESYKYLGIWVVSFLIYSAAFISL